MNITHIELHIEELVLQGFAPGDRYRIARAIESELVRLFIERGMPSHLIQGWHMASLNATSFEVNSSNTAQTVGVKAAQTLFGGLSR